MDVKRVTQYSQSGPIGGRTGLNVKLWPNGEVVIWKSKSFKMQPLIEEPDATLIEVRMAKLRIQLAAGSLGSALAEILGLSPHPIFDKDASEGAVQVDGELESRAVKGLKGITSYGGRMVRNAAHLLEDAAGKARCIFTTVTVPNLPVEQMRIIHEKWHQATEYYRLNVGRALKAKNLSGEIVTVSEIQEERYEETGMPVLHLHAVFVGVTRQGRFAITTEQHDDLWYRAVSSIIDVDRDDISAACNMQRVKESAAAYLGKYISKGVKRIEKIASDGFGGWLPKHWWNCTRSLVRRVKKQTRRVDDLADWLNGMAEVSGSDVWVWHRDVQVEMSDGYLITVARYGRLTKRQTAEIQMHYP